MERKMETSYGESKTWIKFHGEVIEETPEHIDLLATDGSEGLVRVFEGAYRITGEKVWVLIGGRAKIMTPPEADPRAFVKISSGEECKKCKSQADCEGTCCTGKIELCCKKDIIVNYCDTPWRCP